MDKELSCNVSIHEEEMDEKKVFVAECMELGISDFGESVDEALDNLKEAVTLVLQEAPEKREELIKPTPFLTTRLIL